MPWRSRSLRRRRHHLHRLQGLGDDIQPPEADQARPGNRVGDISHAVQERVEAAGFSVIRTLVGHGVGREMHEDPQVPNYGPPGKGPKLRDGMVLAIEPMVNVGGPEVHMASDGWSVYTDDGSQSAHFEFTVAVTDKGPRILNPWHELVRERR